MKLKKIPIGIEFYKEMIDKNYYYVDKTLLIRDIFDKGGKVNLFTRPRRFGKTLALTMLKTFFEAETDRTGQFKDNSRYFENTLIMEAGEQYTCHMGQYPVIFMSLKSAKQPTFEMAYKCLLDEILQEYERHRYVLTGDCLTELKQEKYKELMNSKADMATYAKSLGFLSECLEQYHGKKAIILLDEYDVPLENSWFRGFYDQMIDFIRSLLESALKTNDSLEFAVLTGCLRISRESIFTGLNNLEIVSILHENFGEYYGFTPAEVQEALHYYGIEIKMEEAKEWYDGYLFGNAEVYNPWSILNYMKTAIANINAFPKPYWSNTSSNSIVKELIEQADAGARDEIEKLIAGGTIEKPIHEDITYGDIYRSQDNLWNFLFFTGYLKACGQRFETNTIYLTMTIPNEEIRYIYINTIREWFQQKVTVFDFAPMYEAMLTGNAAGFESAVTSLLQESISYHDNAETFYHGFMLGLLRGLNYYQVQSNRESGEGRPDIVLKPFDALHKQTVILELKCVKNFNQMEDKCYEALAQIEELNYEAGLLEEGYRNILKYGICFCKKSCMVRN